ncbi:unnamed protein product [Owenia fusiformis]|uniref:Uncharacterized protein n=1 Tax=Owenia fusiformis TaxID=6347 RepID=A0A8J1U203_OWEFU|nr:unnamed protein product [Owenia fusiformis]
MKTAIDLYHDVKFEHEYGDTYIAKGSFGSCRQRTYTKTGRTVVIKKMVGKLDSINRKELEFAAVNPHRNIVPVLGYIILPDDEEIYLFMENGGDALSSFNAQTKQYLAGQFLNIMRCCLEAVGHLHHNGYLYLDAKPANTLINIRADGTCNAKLCDMGSLFEVLPIVLDNPITASDEQQNDNTLVPPPATSGRGTESMMGD